MTKQPLVSVLMTAYNREKLIAEAIESVLASSYSDFELIIVDDCSTDGTVGVAYKYAEGDSRIRVYENRKNLGQFPNRNYAASLAKGNLLKYLDSDDIIYPHGLEVMVDSISRFPSAGFAMQAVEGKDVNTFPTLVKKDRACRKHFLEEAFLIIGPSGVIFRKEAFQHVGGFPSNNYVGNDTVLLVELAKRFDVVVMSRNLIWWREHSAQAFRMGISTAEYLVKEYDVAFEHIVNCRVLPLNASERTQALRKLNNLYLGRALKLLKRGRFDLLWLILRHTRFLSGLKRGVTSFGVN